MSRMPLMPMATAVWLVENTSLTFEQIADFCSLHELEVKGIADGEVAQGIRGKDPITSGELTRDEIKRAQADASYRLKIAEPKVDLPAPKAKKGHRYTPLSRRQDRPNAILWLVRYHPELKDSQIVRLVGTTKPTIEAVRSRTHWRSSDLQPQDPVTLGLCTQIELDGEVRKAAKRVERERKAAGLPALEPGETLVDSATTMADSAKGPAEGTSKREAEPDAASVFGAPSAPAKSDDDDDAPIDADSVFGTTRPSED